VVSRGGRHRGARGSRASSGETPASMIVGIEIPERKIDEHLDRLRM
jgi:hypothetical protein